MKFTSRSPEELVQSADWTGYKTIGPFATWVKTSAVLLSTALYVGGYFIWPVKLDLAKIIASPVLYTLGFVLIVAATVVLHEVIHLLASPGGLSGKDAVIGVSLRRFAFFAYSSARTNWRESIIFLLAPLIVLMLLLGGIALAFDLKSGWFGVVVVINASLAANDIVVAAIIFFRVPRDATNVQPGLDCVRYLCALDSTRDVPLA